MCFVYDRTGNNNFIFRLLCYAVTRLVEFLSAVTYEDEKYSAYVLLILFLTLLLFSCVVFVGGQTTG